MIQFKRIKILLASLIFSASTSFANFDHAQPNSIELSSEFLNSLTNEQYEYLNRQLELSIKPKKKDLLNDGIQEWSKDQDWEDFDMDDLEIQTASNSIRPTR